MGVAVLHPQDILRNHHQWSRVNSHPNRPNPRRKQNPSLPRKSRATSPPHAPSKPTLVHGQVKILKRGVQQLPSSPPPTNVFVNGNDRTGVFYAAIASPPASSVPVPGFLKKNFVSVDDATTDLRRILGLNL